MEKKSKQSAGIGRRAVTQMEAMSGKLDLFSSPPTEVHIQDIKHTTYECTGMDTRGPYQFRIDPIPNHFVDLSTLRLFGRYKLEPVDPEQKTIGESTTTINMTPQSLFSSIDTYLNDHMVSEIWTPAMQYKAYIETLMSYDNNAANTHLKAQQWTSDPAGHFDDVAKVKTSGGRSQFNLTKEVDFSMPLHEDLCTSPKYIPPNVEIKYRLTRSPDSFVLLQTEHEAPADLTSKSPLLRVKIVELKLEVRKIQVDPTFCNAIDARIRGGGMPQFPYIKSEIHTRQINSGQRLFSSHLLLVGDDLPRSLVMGLVQQKAFNGDRFSNPYNFKHFNLEEAWLTANESMKPMDHYRYDFKGGHYRRGYRQLMDNTGIMNSRETNMITPDLYKGGCFFIAWDLSECLNYHRHLPLSGRIDVNLKFSDPLPHNLTLVCFVTKHDTLYLDRHYKPMKQSDINPPPHKRLSIG